MKTFETYYAEKTFKIRKFICFRSYISKLFPTDYLVYLDQPE